MADPFDALRRPLGSTEVPAELRGRVLAELRRAADVAGRQPDPHPAGAPSEPNVPEVVLDMEALAPRRANLKRALPAVAVAAALLLVVGTVVVMSRHGDDGIRTVDSDETTITPQSTSSVPASPGASAFSPVERLEAVGAQSFSTGRQPQFVTVGGGGVWINRAAQHYLWLDGTTGRERGTVPIYGNQTQDARGVVGFGSLWVQEPLTGRLHRIDVDTGAVQASIPVPGGFVRASSWVPDPVVGDGGVWVLSYAQPRQLVKVDPASNTIVTSLPAGEVATTMAYGEGSLWVTRGETLSRIDPASGRELASIELPASFDYVLVADSGVWLYGIGTSSPTVAHVDPATNEVVAQISVSTLAADPMSPYDIAAGGGYIWVVTADALLVKIDPESNRVVARYGDTPGGGGVAADDTAVWVTSYRDGTVYRLPLG